MIRLNKFKLLISAFLSLVLTTLQVTGWQISMNYGSSVHQSGFFQSIGSLSPLLCLTWGIIEFLLLLTLTYFVFSYLESRNQKAAKTHAFPLSLNKIGIICFLFMGISWLFFLWSCYPGYYNYDMGNQLPQFLYDEVPYNTHHPLSHTLFSGALISLGYRITGVDISFGVFLYNAVQMLITAACLSFLLRFIHKRTGNIVITALSLAFFSLNPPIVMFAMSTTKDVLCYAFLSVAFVLLFELFDALSKEEEVSVICWIFPGIFLVLSCLIRKNIIYAIVLFIVFSIILLKKERKKQLLLYISVILLYFAIDKSLMALTHATPGQIDEALCVPYQQLSRLCAEKGADAFTEEEYDFLSSIVSPDALVSTYDPVMADHSKAQFSAGLDVLLENKGEFFTLWLKKAFEYPDIFIESFLYNTYQAWYPGTSITDARGVRYFDITGWNDEYGIPHWQGLFDFYTSIRHGSHESYPILRLLFPTGTMFWISIIFFFYGLWKKNRTIITSMLLILLISATNLCGPVSDIRYYLYLFYLAPVFIGIMLQKNTAS